MYRLILKRKQGILLNVNLKTLATAAVIPLAVGAVSGWITRDSMDTYGQLVRPPLSPPGWVFPAVWTVLFLFMGIASYLVYAADAPQQSITRALSLYALQLAVNFVWPILFFRFEWYFVSFLWLVLLWVLIFGTIVLFYQISKPAAWLLVPYLLWVTFAGYLNYMIYLLN